MLSERMKPDCLKSNVVGEKSYSFALEIIHIAATASTA